VCTFKYCKPETFDSRLAWLRHESSHWYRWQCGTCHAQLSSELGWKEHILSAHAQQAMDALDQEGNIQVFVDVSEWTCPFCTADLQETPIDESPVGSLSNITNGKRRVKWTPSDTVILCLNPTNRFSREIIEPLEVIPARDSIDSVQLGTSGSPNYSTNTSGIQLVIRPMANEIVRKTCSFFI